MAKDVFDSRLGETNDAYLRGRGSGNRVIGDSGHCKDSENWFDWNGGLGYFGPGEKATDINLFGLVQDKLKPVGTERYKSGFSRSDNP